MRIKFITKAHLIFFIAFFVFSFKSANALTITEDISLYITTDTTWHQNDDLTFNQDIVIVDGATLTIEPGAVVTVGLKPNSESATITVDDGKIVAIGTPFSPIKFTAASGANLRLNFLNNLSDNAPHPEAVSILKFVDISHGGYEQAYYPVAYNSADYINKEAAINYYSGKLLIENSTFHDNTYADILASGIVDQYHRDDYLKVSNSNFEGVYPEKAVVAQGSCLINNEQCRDNVYLQNNWYGNEYGPTITGNWTIHGKTISGNYVLDGFSRVFLEYGEDRSNILFIPGLEASRLYRDGLFLEDQLWEPNNNTDVKELFLNQDGKSINDNIYTRDVIDEANILLAPQKNIYKSLLTDLENWKMDDELFNDYAVAPYDWRYALTDILNSGSKNGANIYYNNPTDKPYLIETLKKLAATSRTQKVTIIAHSNGGLLAKALIQKLGGEAGDLIDNLILVSVPQAGTPQAIGGLLHGYEQGLPNDFFSFFLTPQTARSLAVNMPSAYHLLPSNNYFNNVTTPAITFQSGALTDRLIARYGDKIDNYQGLKGFLLDDENKVPATSDDITTPGIVNHDLINYGENTHNQIDDNWQVPNTIKIHQIAGFGEETLGSIKYWTGKECALTIAERCLTYRDKLQYSPETVIDGDGTVLTPSALMMATGTNVSRWWVDLDDYNIPVLRSIEHSDILEIDELREFIIDEIMFNNINSNDDFDDIPGYIYKTKPAYTGAINRLQYILHSPLDLSIRDSSGNTVSSTTAMIDGARFKRFGEVQYISVPADVAHTVSLQGTGSGSFTLEMRELNGEQVVATTTFAAIPCATGTRVSMAINNGHIETAGELNIDYDGDGTVDLVLAPRVNETVTGAEDQTPPEAEIYFDESVYDVRVRGIDDSPAQVVYLKQELKKDVYLIDAIITDAAGNRTVLNYRQKNTNKFKTDVNLNHIVYNNEETTAINASLTYKWKGRPGSYKMFAAFLENEEERMEMHYIPRQGKTVIMTYPEKLNENPNDSDFIRRPIKETSSGLNIPTLETDEGEVNIEY